jgi:hypothetical protein
MTGKKFTTEAQRHGGKSKSEPENTEVREITEAQGPGHRCWG